MKPRKPERPCPDVAMFIGDWSNSERGERLPVVNSASDESFGEVPKASRFDLDRGGAAGERTLRNGIGTPPLGCEKIMKKQPRCWKTS
jgi:hypothetical protein